MHEFILTLSEEDFANLENHGILRIKPFPNWQTVPGFWFSCTYSGISGSFWINDRANRLPKIGSFVEAVLAIKDIIDESLLS